MERNGQWMTHPIQNSRGYFAVFTNSGSCPQFITQHDWVSMSMSECLCAICRCFLFHVPNSIECKSPPFLFYPAWLITCNICHLQLAECTEIAIFLSSWSCKPHTLLTESFFTATLLIHPHSFVPTTPYHMNSVRVTSHTPLQVAHSWHIQCKPEFVYPSTLPIGSLRIG